MKLSNSQIIVMIAGVSIFIVAIAVFPVNGIFITVPKSQVNNINTQTPSTTVSTGSVINATVVNTKSNTTGVTNLIDSVGGGSKFVLQVSSILYDSSQKQFPQNTFLNIPLATQSLVDAQGHLLDLGSMRISLSAITSSENQVYMTGEMQVFLDNSMIGDYQLYVQGMTSGKSIPISINGQKDFSYVFADIGKTWADGSTHIFKIQVTKIQATLGTGQAIQSYSSNSQFLVFLLPMTFDANKITVLGVDNQAITVLKSDVSLISSSPTVTVQTNCDVQLNCHNVNVGGKLPDIKVYDNGFLLGSGSKITGLPRNELLTFVINGASINVKTPITTYVYTINCVTPTYPPIVTNGIAGSGTYGATVCQSNFGWGGSP